MTETAELREQEERDRTVPLAYQPIAEAAYDRGNFLKAHDLVQKLTKNRTILESKDSTDKDKNEAREEACEIIFDDAGAAEALPQKIVGGSLSQQHSRGSTAMQKYVKRNLEAFFDILAKNGDSLVSLAVSTQLLNTKGRDKEHDYLTDIMKRNAELIEAQKAASEGDDSKVKAFVKSRIEAKGISKEDKAFLNYLASDPRAMVYVFNRMAMAQGELATGVLYGKDKKPNIERLKSLVKTSLDIAHREYDKEENSGDKSDIYDAHILPVYMRIADLAYSIEKAEADKKDTKKVARKERKAERKKHGMAV